MDILCQKVNSPRGCAWPVDGKARGWRIQADACGPSVFHGKIELRLTYQSVVICIMYIRKGGGRYT
jgi:hypothetical protein